MGVAVGFRIRLGRHFSYSTGSGLFGLVGLFFGLMLMMIYAATVLMAWFFYVVFIYSIQWAVARRQNRRSPRLWVPRL